MEVKIWKCKLSRLTLHNSSIKEKLSLISILPWIVGIFYAYQSDQIVSRALVCKKCWKYPFISAHDLVIGPVFTLKEMRGKGISPLLITEILDSQYYECAYAAINADNISSVKCFTKAGFIDAGFIIESRHFRKYTKTERTTNIRLYAHMHNAM